MKYYNLKSLLSSGKKAIALRESSSSFFIADESSRPYIEPSLEKIIFDIEKPSIILVSAVGATGKTALAQQLSRETGLPLLDLGKHKPVGGNTLTGLLTHAVDVKDIGAVFQGLSSGSYGVIIDGIDEGRSKTTEKAFEAFLDDVARLCQSAKTTTFVLLGRTQILDDCWTYLSEKEIKPGLITISPFTIDAAKQYIDAFTGGVNSTHELEYVAARDTILRKLSRAFTGGLGENQEGFLSFIGYPPVLDAIVTLLTEEKNYYKLLESLAHTDGSNVEVSLLHRIAEYILQRERDLKVIPNIVTPLLEDAPQELQSSAAVRAFSVEEQCIRLVAHCLGKQLSLSRLGDPTIDEKYEARLAEWLPEHPFISIRQFRSAVFEALALATLVASRNPESESLLNQYIGSHKHSYHFVYMVDIILADHRFPIGAIGALLGAAMEFRSVHSVVELRVNGPDWEADVSVDEAFGDIEIEIEILLGADKSVTQTFSFQGEITPDSHLSLGTRLGGAFISVPCHVQIGGLYELELIAPVEITAKSVSIDAKALVLRSPSLQGERQEVIVESHRLQTGLEKITTNGIPLVFGLEDMSGLSYPAIQYAQRRPPLPADPQLRRKYFRLRRILMEFRSHSRGALARYKNKIEHERVLKNQMGQEILTRLIADKILTLKGNIYYLDPSELSNHLGVSWQDLRKGMMPERLLEYMRSIA